LAGLSLTDQGNLNDQARFIKARSRDRIFGRGCYFLMLRHWHIATYGELGNTSATLECKQGVDKRNFAGLHSRACSRTGISTPVIANDELRFGCCLR
jgi:hypothetical protein